MTKFATWQELASFAALQASYKPTAQAAIYDSESCRFIAVQIKPVLGDNDDYELGIRFSETSIEYENYVRDDGDDEIVGVW